MPTLRAAYQPGYIQGQAFDSSPNIPSPSNWGWTEKEGQWQPISGTNTTQHSIWDARAENVDVRTAVEAVVLVDEKECHAHLCKICNGNCDNSRNIYV